jgi:hypothetical protein
LKIPKKGRLPAKKPKNLPPRVGFSDSLPSINGTITKQINVNLINIAIISTIFDEHRSKAIDFYAKFVAAPAGPLDACLRAKNHLWKQRRTNKFCSFYNIPRCSLRCCSSELKLVLLHYNLLFAVSAQKHAGEKTVFQAKIASQR